MIFYIVGIIITFFLVFILATKRNKSKADKILALWLFVTGLHLLLYYLYVTEKYIEYPYLLGFEIPMPLLHGPFLFLYTSALTTQGQDRKNNALHFIPFIITLLLLLPFFTLSFTQKIEVYKEEGKGYEQLMSFIFCAIVLSGCFYTASALRKLSKHRKLIAAQFSFAEKINLKWLTYLIWGSSIIWLLVVFSPDSYIFSAIVLYVLFIGYFGINQVGIFTNKESSVNAGVFDDLQIIEIDSPLLKAEIELASENNSGKIKYEKSGLNLDDLETIHEKLSKVMQSEKLYKNSELTLSDLAQKIKVHPNVLSQVINSLENKNFYDYINDQRIEEFKRIVLLDENQKFTLLALAFDCGFNSKTSFNRNFKKVTFLSPSEYLKQANINLQ